MSRHRTTLEPLGRLAFLTVIGHAVAGAGLFAWWQLSGANARGGDAPAARHWFSPADIEAASVTLAKATPITPATPPTAPPSAAPSRPSPPPAPAASVASPAPSRAKSGESVLRLGPGGPPRIEVAVMRAQPVSTAKAVAAPKTTATLHDIARLDQASAPPAGADDGVDMSAVDRAVIDTYRRVWMPPRPYSGPATAYADVRLDRRGRVTGFKLAKPSGDEAVDFSVQEAGALVKKIPVTLPAQYSRDEYEFQVHFHAE